MDFRTLTPDLVEALHDAALNPGELPGRSLDKSLEVALGRVDNRLAYGLVEDLFDLAAAYCMAVAQGHRISDGNKRTAFYAMDDVLTFNGRSSRWTTEEVGQIVIGVAQRQTEEGALADWLRDRT